MLRPGQSQCTASYPQTSGRSLHEEGDFGGTIIASSRAARWLFHVHEGQRLILWFLRKITCHPTYRAFRVRYL